MAWGDAQLSVPLGWTLAPQCPAAAATILLGTSQIEAFDCSTRPESSVIVTAVESISGTPITLNGILAFRTETSRQTNYDVPSLGVDIATHGPGALRVIDTLTHAPRQAVLSDGPPPSPPTTWKAISFDGLSFSVPPADAANEQVAGDYPQSPCGLFYALPYGLTEDLDTRELIPSCPIDTFSTPTDFSNPEPGVLIDARVSAGSGRYRHRMTVSTSTGSMYVPTPARRTTCLLWMCRAARSRILCSCA